MRRGLVVKHLRGERMKWTDKDGIDYEVEYMTDSHLTNVLNYIRKYMEADTNYIPPPSYNSLLDEYNIRKNGRKN